MQSDVKNVVVICGSGCVMLLHWAQVLRGLILIMQTDIISVVVYQLGIQKTVRISLDRCIKLLQRCLRAAIGTMRRFAGRGLVLRAAFGRIAVGISVLAGRAELYGARNAGRFA